MRGSLKFAQCNDWVTANVGTISWSAVDALISENNLFETDTPIGAPLNNAFNYMAVINAFQSVVVDTTKDNMLPPPAPAMSRHVQFWGVDDAKTWWYSIDDGDLMPVYPCVAQDCFINVQDDQDFTSLESHITIPVYVGDRVSIYTYASYTPHSLLFWLSNRLDAQIGMASDLTRFFTDMVMGPDMTLEMFQNYRFEATDTDYFYGDATPMIGSNMLFTGVVAPSAIGTDEYSPPTPFDIVMGRTNHMELYFTDAVYGPAAMTVRLHVISRATHFVNL